MRACRTGNRWSARGKGARIWPTRPSTRWTWRPERSSPSRCMGLKGDTKTIQETVAEAGERITSIVADTDNAAVAQQVSAEGPREVVTDKGYHSRAVVSEMAEWGVRTYCSEPDRGRQRWPEQKREHTAAH